jgi:hypothetical protein
VDLRASKALDANDDGAGQLGKYEQRVRRAMDVYWEMVEGFYTTPFMEFFFAPREKYQLASAVNAILAGEVEGGFRLKWRLRLFFLLVKLACLFQNYSLKFLTDL